ncbi:hypothetical protein BSU04_33090 [Caballeronia sordidicola]|jgi:hypothetical protein|uniref:Uncharacterized protein n=1 Tax=Caballeronia sordidicola TaxID=196367 RepID=A0A226WTL2_CABSO|nr:hypothetical protein BSU04_33090 [Caballeronia sordidicola]
MRYARLIMTHHGKPELSGFSNRLYVPTTTAQCGQWPSAMLHRVRFVEQTASMVFDMRALAIN